MLYPRRIVRPSPISNPKPISAGGGRAEVRDVVNMGMRIVDNGTQVAQVEYSTLGTYKTTMYKRC